jgi:SAM-dependent methyltransferase
LLERRARSFAGVVDAYERARPGYPRAAAKWLLERAPGRRVVELGAGTGKFSRLLVELGCELRAVEPLDEMRAVLERSLPQAHALDGSAEAIPAGDGSADAVLAAQAFHWFDHPRALAEIARVLVPGGVLGFLWNLRDERVEWVAELSRILGEGGGDGTTQEDSSFAWSDWSAMIAASGRYGPLEHSRSAHAQELDASGLVERVRSTSWVATREEDERERILAGVAALCRSHPELRGRARFALPYVTVAYRTARLPAPAG